MIISRTPLRISFVGGGSDLPSYYRFKPGAVVTTSINKYIYITVNKKFDNRIRASYSKTENVDSADQIEHRLIRECLKKVGIWRGIEVTSMSDIPSEGTGLGSSSAYTVGLLNALYAYKGVYASAERLAREACEVEIDTLKDPIGKQDHYIAAYGGFQFIQFFPDGNVAVNPIICSPETKIKLQKDLLLFYTGLTRSSSGILKNQKKNMEKQNTRGILEQMVEIAHKMKKDLNNNSLRLFGEYLDQNWKLKKMLAEGITSGKIDGWYRRGLKKGAKGGKILGAGGGGFLLLFVKPTFRKALCLELKELTSTDFAFEPQGSKIIFVSE